MKNIALIFVFIFALSGCVFQPETKTTQDNNQKEQTTTQENLQTTDQPLAEAEKTEPEVKVEEPIVVEPEVPATYDTKVAFITQAPFSKWVLPYEEACEEASLIQASKFFRKEELTKTIMNDEILKVVEWEKKYFGFYESTDTYEVLDMAHEYFKLDAEISKDVTIDNIKKIVSQGNLIIVPTAGRMLDNPYFTGEGPLYHMLIIRGYDRDEFITNDVGIGKGEGFKYTYKNLMDSIHDYNKGDIYNGEKMMIVVKGVFEENPNIPNPNDQ